MTNNKNEIKIPKREILWQTIYNEYKNPIYIVTSNTFRDKYYLYLVDEKLQTTKIETNSIPVFKKINK